MIAPHNLVIYQKPKRGNKPLRSAFVFNYKHKISAYGWFDTAECDLIPVNATEGMRFVEQFIGNRVAVFVDNPYEPCWEGLISRITLNTGGATYTISIEDMYNTVQVNYTTSASAFPSQSGLSQQLTSQAVYGVKQGVIEGGVVPGGGGTQFDGIRKSMIEMVGYPQSSITPGDDSATIHLEMMGIYHTLRWQLNFNVTTPTVSYSNFINTYILSILNNGATFFDNTDLSGITTVAALRTQGDAPGKTLWDQLETHTHAGDNNGTPYVVGITPTDPRTNKRKLYYRPANLDIQYKAWRRDGFRIRNFYGRLVPPWKVRPDRSLRVDDMLLAYGLAGDDPRDVWVQSIDYDGETGKVLYYGADDTSVEGAFQYKTGLRPQWYGRRNGGRARVS